MSERIAVLVRHGRYRQLPDTPSAHQPFALTPAGVADAERGAGLVGAMARDLGCAIHPVLHTSSLLRAWQTADVLRSGLAAVETLRQTEALAERSVGQAANLTLAQIEQALREDPRHAPPPAGWKSSGDYRLPLPGAESLHEAGERVAAYLRAVMSERHEKAGGAVMVLFVGHGAAFRHAARHLGALEPAEVDALSMYHAAPVALAAPAAGAWRHVAGEWKPRLAHRAELD